MALEMLNAFDKPPSENAVCILLLGSEGVGKQKLARSIINVNTSFSVAIRTASSLPLSKGTAADRPRIDFIAFMIDLTNKESMKDIERWLVLVDMEYFLGRSCFVVCQVEETLKNIIQWNHVAELGKKYHIPALCAQSIEETQLSVLAKRIIELVRTATCFRHFVTPALIDTTKDYSVT